MMAIEDGKGSCYPILVARRYISAGEELVYDYGGHFGFNEVCLIRNIVLFMNVAICHKLRGAMT
jgi:hypothetical protein